jgi:phosphatidylglycerol:prolipoprotein diacylglycerol transferase
MAIQHNIIEIDSPIILPDFNPFAVDFGGFGIRWYALAYIVGILAGYIILRREASTTHSPLSIFHVDSLLNHVLIGIIIGGRAGYVLFYNSSYYLKDPVAVFRIWEGGMAFHGALLGIILSVLVMARHHRIPFLTLTDRISLVVPIGLFLGRLSNFINSELYGRVTTVSWAMVFPNSDGQPRHPSQLYEAGSEGLLLGLLLILLWRKGWLGYPGRLSGALLAGYGFARVLIEIVRQPDPQLGLFYEMFSMGQLLSLPMILVGSYLVMRKL